jgi:hypothetical protein
MDPAVAESFYAQTAAGAKIELSWNRAWSRVTINGNGSTGWATVVATSVDAAPYGGGILCVEAGKVVRVHLRSHEPCSANFPSWKERGWETLSPAEDVKSEADQTWPPWPSSSSSTGWRY